MAAKKRLTMFDAMDGALTKISGLAEAAEKAKTLPFHLKAEPASEPAAPRQTEAALAASSPSFVHQMDPSDGSIIRSNQTSPSEAQMYPSDEPVRPSDRSITRIHHTTPSDESIRQKHQTSPPHKPTATPHQTDPSDGINSSHPPVPILIAPQEVLRTPTQKAVVNYFVAQGSHVSTYRIISLKTGVSQHTVRDVVTKLSRLGWLAKEDWYGPGGRGLQFHFFPEKVPSHHTGPSDEPTIQTHQINTSDRTIKQHHQTTPSEQALRQNAPYKEDRKIENLSISSERIALTWPNLRRAGFDREQLEQIAQALAELGKPADKVYASLDHAEWELEHGQMVDKEGQPVSDPCAWVFRSLARTGYYRRPKGYVSAEEQAARDIEAEAKAVIAARQAAETARFEAWKSGLSEAEKSEAMRGHPGGPKDAWLRRVWRKATGENAAAKEPALPTDEDTAS
jgi:hypothetical protein